MGIEDLQRRAAEQDGDFDTVREKAMDVVAQGQKSENLCVSFQTLFAFQNDILFFDQKPRPLRLNPLSFCPGWTLTTTQSLQRPLMRPRRRSRTALALRP